MIAQNTKDKRSPLYILGEIHGAAANVKAIQSLTKLYGIKTILLELEERWQETLTHFKYQKAANGLRRENWLRESGLIGHEHLAFFEKFYKEGGHIFAAKCDDSDWNKAESETTRFMKKYLNSSPNNPTLAVMGKLHARKRPFRLQNKEYKPLGYRLRSNSISIQLRYGQGYFYNFGKKTLSDPEVTKKMKTDASVLIPSRSPYFDYDYLVATTKPLTLL